MKRAAFTRESAKADFGRLQDSLEHSPGVYEVMRLYVEYQQVLEKCRAYLVGRLPEATGFSSTDRTG